MISKSTTQRLYTCNSLSYMSLYPPVSDRGCDGQCSCTSICLTRRYICLYQIVDVTGKLEAKKKEIERLVEKDKALTAQFQASLGDNNKFADYLTKVFRKKIKRSKKKAAKGDGGMWRLH